MVVKFMSTTKEQDVAIILLNWNAYNDTIECLKSLNEIKNVNFQVFLADNKSTDDSFIRLQEEYNKELFTFKITFIQTGDNLGFAGGNNVAIKEAYKQGFEYYWLLNTDTVVDKNALLPLINVIKQGDKVGIVGSKIYYHDSNLIWFAGGRVNRWTGKSKHIGINEEDNAQYNQNQLVDYISGCSLLFKKEILDLVGYMSEDYFLYYEETDWNIRVKDMGYKIIYVPESVVYHKVSSSTGGIQRPNPILAYYYTRNSLMMIRRTQNKLKYVIAIIYSIQLMLVRILKTLFFLDRKLLRIKYITSGFQDCLCNKVGKIK
jgi:GT2 family glycosyltransferase